MRLSVQTGTPVKKYGIDKGFEMIKAAGFDCVDFGFDGPTWEEVANAKNISLFEDENVMNAYIDEINAAKKKHGIEIGQCHAPFPAYIKDNEAAIKMMRDVTIKSVEICGKIGCKILVVHPAFNGSARFPTKRETEWEWSMELYTSLIPYLEKYGVTCALENMWGQDWATKAIYTAICSDIPEACRYIDKLNEIAGKKMFGFCLDTGHLTLLGLDMAVAIEQLGDRMCALHVHDNDRINDLHICPYDGISNWERFILGMKRSNYKGTLNFEADGTLARKPGDVYVPALAQLYAIGKYFDKRISEKD